MRSPLARRVREVGVQHVVALEADALDLLEEQREQRHELRGLEQVDVERVLEVGGRVRRDHERGAVGGAGRARARRRGATGFVKCSMMCDDRPRRRCGRGRRAAAPSIAANRSVGAARRIVAGVDDRGARCSRRRRRRGRARRASRSRRRRRSRCRGRARAEAGDDLAVARIVEREQGVGRRALHRPFAGELLAVACRSVATVRTQRTPSPRRARRRLSGSAQTSRRW